MNSAKKEILGASQHQDLSVREERNFWNGPQAAGAVAFADIYCEIKPQDIEFSMFLWFF